MASSLGLLIPNANLKTRKPHKTQQRHEPSEFEKSSEVRNKYLQPYRAQGANTNPANTTTTTTGTRLPSMSSGGVDRCHVGYSDYHQRAAGLANYRSTKVAARSSNKIHLDASATHFDSWALPTSQMELRQSTSPHPTTTDLECLLTPGPGH